jgi:hypothetical protein
MYKVILGDSGNSGVLKLNSSTILQLTVPWLPLDLNTEKGALTTSLNQLVFNEKRRNRSLTEAGEAKEC